MLELAVGAPLIPSVHLETKEDSDDNKEAPDMLFRPIREFLEKRDWSALLLEFVIVVVGVFVGLQAQQWNTERENRQRLERIVAALKADMADARRIESGFQKDIQYGLAAFDEARRQGERPPPFFYQIRGSDTAPKLIWGTLQDAGLGELLDTHLLFELSHFYSERDGIGIKVTRYMESIERLVLPYVEGDPDHFYDPASGRMRPEYKATMDRLREWMQYSVALAPWSECLEKRRKPRLCPVKRAGRGRTTTRPLKENWRQPRQSTNRRETPLRACIWPEAVSGLFQAAIAALIQSSRSGICEHLVAVIPVRESNLFEPTRNYS